MHARALTNEFWRNCPSYSWKKYLPDLREGDLKPSCWNLKKTFRQYWCQKPFCFVPSKIQELPDALHAVDGLNASLFSTVSPRFVVLWSALRNGSLTNPVRKLNDNICGIAIYLSSLSVNISVSNESNDVPTIMFVNICLRNNFFQCILSC